jgi:diguanylate cyclase (GGDEF)-like protein/PAS domain S-box-containing protein
VTDARIAITLVPLLIPGVIEIWQWRNGRDANPLPLFAASLILVVLAFVRSARLVQARNRQEAALEQRTLYFAALAENSSDAVIVVDRDGRILNEAPNLAGMLGRPGAATTGMDAIELLRPIDRDGARGALNRWWLTSGLTIDAEVQATHADGTDRWFGVRAANLSDNPVVGGMVINLRDITDRKRAEQELSHNAFHDSLTGLANRALFNDRLEHAISRTSRTGLDVAVVYLDLDGFKMINDTRGHEAGDRVLREVGARLLNVVRTSDTVSRLGGDEFAILIEESSRALDEAEILAARVLQSLTTPFAVDSQQVVLSASIGIALGDISGTASSMMGDADIAMYKAKTAGAGRWAVYEPGMRSAALARLELESDLYQALAKHQFRLVVQPVIALESNKVVGFEALLRWDHPTIGMIEPDAFIPLAESNGTIVEIGRWVLDAACRTAARWNRSNPSARLTMAVNISARQIATPGIIDHVAAALRSSQFPPELLILEMTESVLVKDADTAARRLQELRALGVRLAIDDFGTGYSSLSYLRKFPIDILKIDRSFTNTITDRSQPPAIVRGLLDLAKTLQMQTVAEGIELVVQLDSLRDQQCDFGQGFLFAKPLEEGDAASLVTGLDREPFALVGAGQIVYPDRS